MERTEDKVVDIEAEAVRLSRKRIPLPDTFAERVHEADAVMGARNGYYMACKDLLPKLHKAKKEALPLSKVREMLKEFRDKMDGMVEFATAHYTEQAAARTFANVSAARLHLKLTASKYGVDL